MYYIVLMGLLVNCSSTRMIDSWKSIEYTNYQPKKVLIVGMTDNLTARKIFEQNLKDEFNRKGIEAVESYDVFGRDFIGSRQTEEQINAEVNRLVNEGYDSVLISAVKGVDEKTTYSGDQFETSFYWRRFGRYYYRFQDVYFQPGYYRDYKVYHIEASLYNIKLNNDKSLVWVASYNIIDPNSIHTTVHDYIESIIQSLENESIIAKNY